jgi:drug/metabolite transporter (DMT)-like permease
VSRTLRPAPPPLEGNDLVITTVLTAAWAVALVVLLVLHDHLPAQDRWWIWVAAFGCFMGLFGLFFVPHLKRSRERAASRKSAAQANESATKGQPGAIR